MPKVPTDYTKTIIYKLVHKEDFDNANIYIGSTTNFRQRKSQHKSSCLNEKSKEYHSKKYQYIRDNKGWYEWNMIEIEKYPCDDKREAEAKEEYWRTHFNALLNSNVCRYPTDDKIENRKNYRRENIDKIKDTVEKHYTENSDKIKNYATEYRNNNVNIIKEKARTYYEENRETKLEQAKQYAKNNADKIKEYKKQYNQRKSENRKLI